MRWMLLPFVGLSSCVFVFRDAEPGEDISETRSVSGFSSVALRGSVDVEVTTGVAESVTVSGPEAAVGRVVTRVEQGVLIVDLNPGFSWDTGRVVVEVGADDLLGLELSGSGTLTADALRSPSVEIDVSGSGVVDVAAVQTDDLVVSLDGSGQVILAGTAEEQVFLLDGSGEIDASALAGARAHVFLGGSGAVALAVSEAVDVQLDGSGVVTYAGAPTVTVTGEGSGVVVGR